MRIIGFKNVDFMTQDNQQIKGYKVFGIYEEKGVEGTACDSFFISENKAGDWKPTVGVEANIFYNKYGKVDRVENVGVA